MNVASVAIGRAYAKLNLHLDVLGKRHDGFHEIRSLVCAADLCDELIAHPANDGCVELTCDDPTLPVDETNLVIRAARQLAVKHAVSRGVRFELRKAIPVGGGMGGGSSDAATALQLLNQFWNLQLPEKELAGLGAGIGSDVPLFFSLPAARIAGRGELVQPVPLRWSGWALLVFGPEPISTAEVYQNWRPENSEIDYDESADVTIDGLLGAATAVQIMRLGRNALEQAVFRVSPRTAQWAQQVKDLTNQTFRITGAGSTLFSLLDSPEDARHHSAKLQEEGLHTCVVRAGGFLMDNW